MELIACALCEESCGVWKVGIKRVIVLQYKSQDRSGVKRKAIWPETRDSEIK